MFTSCIGSRFLFNPPPPPPPPPPSSPPSHCLLRTALLSSPPPVTHFHVQGVTLLGVCDGVGGWAEVGELLKDSWARKERGTRFQADGGRGEGDRDSEREREGGRERERERRRSLGGGD
eukprot:756214-Hanusia_phi.AAC.5